MIETYISIELRCKRHLHGVLQIVSPIKPPLAQPHSVYVKQCRQCSKDSGRPVFHRWDAVTGEMIEGDAERDDALDLSRMRTYDL